MWITWINIMQKCCKTSFYRLDCWTWSPSVVPSPSSKWLVTYPWCHMRSGRSSLTASLLRLGFRKILTQVLKLKRGGLLVGGPPCGSWIWISRATSKRTQSFIFGNTQRSFVKDANTRLNQSLFHLYNMFVPNLSFAVGFHASNSLTSCCNKPFFAPVIL